MKIGAEVLSNVGAQDVDTSRYQMSDLVDIEFYYKIYKLDVESVSRPEIETPFSPTVFTTLEM